MEELREKIKNYEEKIQELETILTSLVDSEDVFEQIREVETKREIKDYQERIVRLQKRIAGQPTIENCPTDEQIALAEWANSPGYDD